MLILYGREIFGGRIVRSPSWVASLELGHTKYVYLLSTDLLSGCDFVGYFLKNATFISARIV
jgi:hypothetical protein